jgi:hypothetical protein
VHGLLKSYHLDVVGASSIPHYIESDAGGNFSSWMIFFEDSTVMAITQ